METNGFLPVRTCLILFAVSAAVTYLSPFLLLRSPFDDFWITISMMVEIGMGTYLLPLVCYLPGQYKSKWIVLMVVCFIATSQLVFLMSESAIYVISLIISLLIMSLLLQRFSLLLISQSKYHLQRPWSIRELLLLAPSFLAMGVIPGLASESSLGGYGQRPAEAMVFAAAGSMLFSFFLVSVFLTAALFFSSSRKHRFRISLWFAIPTSLSFLLEYALTSNVILCSTLSICSVPFLGGVLVCAYVFHSHGFRLVRAEKLLTESVNSTPFDDAY